MKRFLLCTLFVLLQALSLQAAGPSLSVDNRVLTVVRQVPITVLDVMKRMDLILQQHYPEAIGNPTMRYQFYSSQWKSILERMIETELMLADAEAIEVAVTDGEVREAIQDRFGPNVISTLNSLGLSYEEAQKIVHDELVQQRMNWFRFQSQALTQVNPVGVKKAYQSYLKEKPPEEKWKYRVISIRDANREIGEAVAAKAYELIGRSKGNLDDLPNDLRAICEAEGTNVQVSQPIEADQKTLAVSHKETLENLLPGEYSAPVSQTSRTDQAIVHRIFYLLEHTKSVPPTFNEVSKELEMKLINDEMQKHQVEYMKKLKKKFSHEYTKLEEMVPPDFQPFVLTGKM